MNKITIIGNLTKDPELTETPNGTPVCKFTVASNRNYPNSSGEREADFFNCTAWRGLGETIARYCSKGSKLFIVGKVETREYEDSDGNKRKAWDIVVDDMEFATPKRADDGEEHHEPPARSQSKPASRAKSLNIEDDDDIPF